MLIASDIRFALDSVAFAAACGIVCDPWQAALLRAAPQRALLCCSRQSGKTTVTALDALHTAVYIPAALVVIASPSQRQSAEMLRTLKLLHGKLDGAPALATESVLKIELANGSRVVALPGTEKTVRGLAGAALVVIDEAARVDEELITAVRPMLATSNGRLTMLSTPAGKRGAFYEAWHGTGGNWHKVSVPASDCPRITQAFLDEERRELGEARFQEEYMLAWLDSLESAFPTTIIDSAFTSEVLPLWQ